MPVLRRVVLAAIATAILSAPAPAQPDNLDRPLWTALKRQVTGSDAQKYYESSVDRCVLPPLKGTLISALMTQE